MLESAEGSQLTSAGWETRFLFMTVEVFDTEQHACQKAALVLRAVEGNRQVGKVWVEKRR